MRETPAIARILSTRLVGIVRLDDLQLTVAAAEAALGAGLQVIEIAFTLPSAAKAIERLRGAHPRALIGAGTVRRLPELEDAVAAGAQFLVAPGLNPALVDAGARRGVPMLPGVFTATEIDTALGLGVDLLKLFPAEPSGPGYVASLRQPFPEARLVPTGGITAANAGAYLAAGSVAVAMGSSLFPPAKIAAQGPAVIAPLVGDALAALLTTQPAPP